MDNSGRGVLQVPGVNEMSIYHTLDPSTTFNDGADGWAKWYQRPRLTAREVAMVQLIANLTNIDKWFECVGEEEIVAIWRENALRLPLISPKTWEWCLAELRDKAVVFKETGRIVILDTGTSVCRFDGVPQKLRDQLVEGIQSGLGISYNMNENQESKTDDSLITNIVNPSMFPLIYGKTNVLREGGTVELNECLESYQNAKIASSQPERSLSSVMFERRISGIPEVTSGYQRDQKDLDRWSTRFQWLPCEVSFRGVPSSDTEVKIVSYINNLHPVRNQPLYHYLETLISLAIEPWNDCLLLGKQNGRVPMRIRSYGTGPGPLCSCSGHYSLCECSIHPEPGTVCSYADWKKGLTSEAVVKKTNHAEPERAGEIRPDPNHEFYNVALQETFREEGLQVIVKISSIDLDPSQHKYKGGDWTLEGQLNEHIVGTAVYFYDVENVTSTSLLFRQETGMNPMNYLYASYDTEDLEAVFGVSDDLNRRTHEHCMKVPPTQTIGSATTPQGRLLAWPNALQHRLESFELIDKSRPGHRRCVVLYLVDPHYRICSTRNVPPQQHEWWAEAALATANFPLTSVARTFPQEVKDLILEKTDSWPIGAAEATEICAEVEKDRARAFDAIMDRMPSYDFYDESWGP